MSKQLQQEAEFYQNFIEVIFETNNFILEMDGRSVELIFTIIITSGFATTHVGDFLWVCKTSYHLLIFPPPTNLPNSLPLPYHSTCHAPKQQGVTL